MKNKGLIFGIITTVALMTAVATGFTMALLKDKTDTLKNTFELGNVETEIKEEGEGAVKKSRIQNVGENDCYVRVRVTISPAKAAEAIELTGKDEENWDWNQWNNGDGYVYYRNPLPAPVSDKKEDESYTSYVFTGVALKNDDPDKWKSLGIDTFEVTVYQEAVQAEMFATNGTSTEDMMTIWKVYDEQNARENFPKEKDSVGE